MVVSEDVRNRMRDDLIVVPVFSRARLGPTRVALPARTSALDHDSVILCEEITTIDRDFLKQGPIGRKLNAGTVDAIVRAIRRAVGEVVPER